MDDILFCTGKEIIDAKYLIAQTEQFLAEMGSEETGSTGDRYSFACCFHFAHLPILLKRYHLWIHVPICKTLDYTNSKDKVNTV